MLAGLLLPIHDADDRPGMLTATLPFGGATLIEYQARLLIAAGVSQLVVMATRLTPELIGAINRIGKRGIAVDTVRSAAEVAERLHPLACVLMLADGLTTTEEAVAAMGREPRDALLVLPERDAQGRYERIGGGLVWAGIARLDPRRLAELARMPPDYDVQSTLVRLASQAHAAHVTLPAGALRGGHGIEHGGTTLEARGRGVLAAMVGGRRGWFDRLVIAPLARAAIPPLVARSIPSSVVGGAAAIIGVLALASAWFGHPVAAWSFVLVATTGLSIAGLLADLRDEAVVRRGAGWAILIIPALVVLTYGHRVSAEAMDGTAMTLAIGLVLIAALAERALWPVRRRGWWGSAPGYAAVLLGGAILAVPATGLGVATLYAAATLVAAIERLRQQP